MKVIIDLVKTKKLSLNWPFFITPWFIVTFVKEKGL